MIALSVRQPWAYAILSLGKTIENRTWSTSYRGPVLIHAGKKIDEEGREWLRSCGFYVPASLVTGAYVGRVTITGCRRALVAERERRSGCGSPTMGGNFWAFGPWCFELREPVAFARPIPGPGRLGLYEVEREQEPAPLSPVLLL